MASSLAIAFQRVGRGIKGKFQATRYSTVASGQTFGVGDFVYLDANGQLTIAAAASNDVGNLRFAGISDGSAAQCLAESRKCGYIPLDGLVFTLPLYHSTASSATLAENETDTPLTLPLRNQGGIWCLNKENNGTNDRFVVLGLSPASVFGENYTLVECAPMDAALLSKAS